MENPFDKYAILNDPSVVKFDIKLVNGKLNVESTDDSNVKLNLTADIYIPFGGHTIKSLDFNLYTMNDKLDTENSNDTTYLKPIMGLKTNVSRIRKSNNLKLRSENGIFKLNYNFEFTSPFIGTDFNLLGINIVTNNESMKNGEITKKNIFTTVIPTYYLEGDSDE
ncbi:hypothetical protein [Companilactobacillus heilongjiangensis]|uniref:Uncharacterized protein n=1 Tax=Companilactobacillus heilongjiangensis TaxID=1074467 RepID=A0A0K2LD93_9LACO|nr:hypothetical protein [Companilactobacillus heilongjiangensis]ALB29235.1 hypothetical protein JP39_07570 [Companilactobacillus heilongjiangensis]